MFLLNLFASFYDRAKSFWLCTAVKQKANVITIIVFFISLACIAANRFGLLPDNSQKSFLCNPPGLFTYFGTGNNRAYFYFSWFGF